MNRREFDINIFEWTFLQDVPYEARYIFSGSDEFYRSIDYAPFRKFDLERGEL